MAAPSNAPQLFHFGTNYLSGNIVSFNGTAKRRHASHNFLKRKGAYVEDMEREQYRLTVRLVFTGPTCSSDYQNFKDSVDKTPTALLVHPISGKWVAFCEGPDE